MKNWTGNKNSTFSTLGASNHSNYERAKHDFYATDPIAIDKLLSVETPYNKIWENACGQKHLANRLTEKGFEVWATDIIDRDGVDKIVDFLDYLTPIKWNGDILTNPPYRWAQEWVERSMNILMEGRSLYLFLKITFLESQSRLDMFKKYPPKKVLIFSKRIQVARNGEEEMFKKSSAACYAWFVWEKGFKGNPIIKWI